MIAEEKIKQVKTQLKRGTPAGEIREEMLREGFSKEDIEQCFSVRKIDMRSWFLFASIIFFFAGLWIMRQPINAVFHGNHWEAFLISAGLLTGHFWPEQKKKKEENV